MSLFGSNLGSGFDPLGIESTHEQVVPDVESRRLAWILAFCGLEVADLDTSVVARRQVAFYLRLDREMARREQVLELEEQWNPLGRML